MGSRHRQPPSFRASPARKKQGCYKLRGGSWGGGGAPPFGPLDSADLMEVTHRRSLAWLTGRDLPRQNSPAVGTEVAGCPLTADLVKGFTEGTSLR
jgi:hypothetical protein